MISREMNREQLSKYVCLCAFRGKVSVFTEFSRLARSQIMYEQPSCKCGPSREAQALKGGQNLAQNLTLRGSPIPSEALFTLKSSSEERNQ